MKGIVNVNKSKATTSAAVVGRLRRLFGMPVGHMGTLDPQGTGVLIIGVGKATRLFDYFLSKDKVYEAEFTFGAETDTLDGEGRVVAESDFIPAAAAVNAALPSLCGKISQLPPRYSAKSVGGVRAYKLARGGVDFELKPAEVEIYSAELLRQTAENAFLLRIHCSSGTYIRSFCRDLAYALGGLAVMTELKRTRCGPFAIETALTAEQIEAAPEAALLKIEDCVDLPVVEAPKTLLKPLLNGVVVRFDAPARFLLRGDGEIIGIAECRDEAVKIKTFLKD